jgi:hypothetical protein
MLPVEKGSIEDAWQTLHEDSSTIATFDVKNPSLLSEPHPPRRTVSIIDIAARKLIWMILRMF